MTRSQSQVHLGVVVWRCRLFGHRWRSRLARVPTTGWRYPSGYRCERCGRERPPHTDYMETLADFEGFGP